ncbi:MAG: MaoC/PaaZ C-terminal domain-containing protein [Actinomycetota bacterium]|jgi:2-methylfumaryl-CoA hydratase|nr:MaoC/PaaZ C-terminal domain-containing protein [Actinomycetota bacterium]
MELPLNDAPYYDQFEKGMTIPSLPPVTLTEADNLTYRMITGDQHLLSADRGLANTAAGYQNGMVYPGLAMMYSIGQTTNATRRAIANLYYRSVRILRAVEVGETLRTTTKVLGLADAKPRGDLHRGKVWLGIETVADGGVVAQYERCALVPSSGRSPGHSDDIPGPSDPAPLTDLADLVPSWDLGGLPGSTWAVGDEVVDVMRDHVDNAPALARMTFNQAFVHRDGFASVYDKRLVFGGHVQGLAQTSLSRMLPGIATVVAWDGCDHVGPAFEGDLLGFRHTLVEETPAGNGRLLRFDVRGAAADADGNLGDDILVWTPIVWAP